jgi:hypothetical protein
MKGSIWIQSAVAALVLMGMASLALADGLQIVLPPKDVVFVNEEVTVQAVFTGGKAPDGLEIRVGPSIFGTIYDVWQHGNVISGTWVPLATGVAKIKATTVDGSVVTQTEIVVQ